MSAWKAHLKWTKVTKRDCRLPSRSMIIPLQETPSHRIVPVNIACVGAEEFFRDKADNREEPHFDKIMFRDALPYLHNTQVSLKLKFLICVRDHIKSSGKFAIFIRLKIVYIHTHSHIHRLRF